jgi:hypothetical protein
MVYRERIIGFGPPVKKKVEENVTIQSRVARLYGLGAGMRAWGCPGPGVRTVPLEP